MHQGVVEQKAEEFETAEEIDKKRAVFFERSAEPSRDQAQEPVITEAVQEDESDEEEQEELEIPAFIRKKMN
jgi:hypothetical protein